MDKLKVTLQITHSAKVAQVRQKSVRIQTLHFELNLLGTSCKGQKVSGKKTYSVSFPPNLDTGVCCVGKRSCYPGEQDKIIISVTRLNVTGQTDWLLESGKCYLHWIWEIQLSKAKEILTMRAFLAEAILQRGKGKRNHSTRQFIY